MFSKDVAFLQFPLNLKDRSVDNSMLTYFIENILLLFIMFVISDGDTIIYNERCGGGFL